MSLHLMGALAAGAVLGVVAMLAWRRLREWHEQRLAGEWDPY